MKLLILFILISLYFSQNIITSWDYDKVAMYDIQKINTFLLTELVNLCYDIPSRVPIVHNINITNIKLIDITTSLHDSYFNYNNGLFLLTPNKITLYFNFSYYESTRGYNDTAILELKIYTLKLVIKNDKISQKPKISCKMSSPIENYNIIGIKDKTFLNLLQDTLFSGFQRQYILSESISGKVNTGLMDYFNKYYSNKNKIIIQTNEFFGNFKFSMKNNKFLYFCEDLIGEFNNNFCYFYGYSNKDEEIKDKTKIPLLNKRFSYNYNQSYNIFINKDLIYDILNYISKSYFYFFPKIYNNKTNIKHLSYEFNVASLKKYFNGLDNFKDNELFYCEIYIDNLNFNETNYRVKFNINDKYFILNVTAKINIDISIIKNIRFNLCLKDSKTYKVEILNYSTYTKIEINNLEGLKNAIDESFDYDYNKICITNNGISMRDYFTKIKDIYIREEGLYLEGNHLYQ